MQLDDAKLIQTVFNEISTLIPAGNKLINSYVIREKRATFSCTIGINDTRPGNSTGIDGLYIAGDYTNTDYPATIEGAVRSGLKAANLITGIN